MENRIGTQPVHVEQFCKHQQRRAVIQQIAEDEDRVHRLWQAPPDHYQRRIIDHQAQKYAQAKQRQGVPRLDRLPVIIQCVQIGLRLGQEETGIQLG
ncbi:MAG: hypothetical protein ACXWAT_09955 [Methylobacter sp.]